MEGGQEPPQGSGGFVGILRHQQAGAPSPIRVARLEDSEQQAWISVRINSEARFWCSRILPLNTTLKGSARKSVAVAGSWTP